jgi:D-alanyl-lipoteichoic acid acyltransferase DltB (MBOAT superfamily)
VAFLGYFKYRNFFLGSLNDAFGTTFVLTHLILTIGISLFTYKKIAIQIDVHSSPIETFTIHD